MMAWKDWFGYPGMLEDQNDEKLMEALMAIANSLKDLSEIVVKINDRVTELEKRK